MSLQVCGCCGWSKVTSYHGLRTHQGKMGCTPKGLKIPESEQYKYSPGYTYVSPTIKMQSFEDLIFSSYKSGASWKPTGMSYLMEDFNGDRSLQIASTPVKTQNLPALPNITTKTPTSSTESTQSVFQTPKRSFEMATSARRALDFSSGAFQMASQSLNYPVTTAQETAAQQREKEKEEEEKEKLRQKEQEKLRQKELEAQKLRQKEQERLWQEEQEKLRQKELERLWQEEQEAQKLRQKEQERLRQKEQEKLRQEEQEKMRQEEQEAQKLLKSKAKQDRMKADLKHKIQMRERKMGEVRSSVKACKGDLDAEWLEINAVFSEVMEAVEEARLEALQPLEERRKSLKQEEKRLLQKLQQEIDKLKKIIDDLDKSPNSKVPPLNGLGQTGDVENVTVDVSFSFGTLRSNTSKMVQRIQEKLEKLSPVEFKRMTTFAVNVKLDLSTAHQCLVFSPDGKKVADGGKNRNVPDSPGRFDAFGSVLGLNRLTSGKSYWEVGVADKTGWDLGVARRSANRKGKLSLTPDDGYWVAVGYESGKYAAMTAPPLSLRLAAKPRRVGVLVDYEGGLVSFYDATAQSHIFSFTGCVFGGEISPYFSPHLEQNGRNSAPLVICSATKLQ